MLRGGTALRIDDRQQERALYFFEEAEDGCEILEPAKDPAYRDDEVDQDDEVETPVSERTGFWRRQFGEEVTTKQRAFDWIFGVIMPVICFAFDPLIFSSGFGKPMMAGYEYFGWTLSFVGIMTMLAWLLFGARLGKWNVLLSGILTAGSLGALVMAVILFPLSVLGLIVIIGALGFTPFFTAVIWGRSAVRSYRIAKPDFDGMVIAHLIGIIAIFSLVIPWLINSELSKSILYAYTGDWLD